MDDLSLNSHFEDLKSTDSRMRKNAFDTFLKITQEPVAWLEERFVYLRELAASNNSYRRSIGVMLLLNLAKSDSNLRLDRFKNQIFALMNDEKLITCRQTIQNIWKLPVANPAYVEETVENLIECYFHCRHNTERANLIRRDVLSSLAIINNNYPNCFDIDKIIAADTNDYSVTIKL